MDAAAAAPLVAISLFFFFWFCSNFSKASLMEFDFWCLKSKALNLWCRTVHVALLSPSIFVLPVLEYRGQWEHPGSSVSVCD